MLSSPTLCKPLKAADVLEAICAVHTATPGPNVRSNASKTLAAASNGKNPAIRSLDILLAEDNAVNQTLARRLLEKQGHKVTVVVDGRQAVNVSAQRSFDLILMDVQMPEMDGYAATEAIRAREGDGKRTPIIALTAHAMGADHQRSIEAGMDAFLTKPIQVNELLKVIETIAEKPSVVL